MYSASTTFYHCITHSFAWTAAKLWDWLNSDKCCVLTMNCFCRFTMCFIFSTSVFTYCSQRILTPHTHLVHSSFSLSDMEPRMYIVQPRHVHSYHLWYNTIYFFVLMNKEMLQNINLCKYPVFKGLCGSAEKCCFLCLSCILAFFHMYYHIFIMCLLLIPDLLA